MATEGPTIAHEDTDDQMLKVLKHFTLKTGCTLLDHDIGIERNLQQVIPGLREVWNVDECDFILVLCPVGLQAKTDIKAAVTELSSLAGNKPAALVVLHKWRSPENVPDSSGVVTRNNTITVDCLYSESQTLLQCTQNDEALSEIINWIQTEDALKRTPRQTLTHDHTANKMEHPLRKYFKLGYDVGIERNLEELVPGLHEVQNLEECDFIFFIWFGFSRARIDIEAALKILNTLPGNKPAALLLLHQTSTPDCVVPDSSRSVNRENIITVDCLINENQELLHCFKNDQALSEIINWLNPEDGLERILTSANHGQAVKQTLEFPIKKYFPVTIGCTFRHVVQIHMELQKSIPSLQEDPDLEECELILVFCSAFSRGRNKCEVAVKTLNSLPGNKPAILVLLHQFGRKPISAPVNRENTIAVNYLLNEDPRFLQCPINDQSLSTIIHWLYFRDEKPIKPVEPRKSQSHDSSHKHLQILKRPPIKHFTLTTGETLGQDMIIERKLYNLIPGLQKVSVLKECDFILVLCPVVTRAGTDIEAAMKELRTLQGDKPAVLVVLHHTFDPECVVADSSRAVTRENTIAVDCLFHEDQGLLQCRKNNEAFTSVSRWIQTHLLPNTKRRSQDDCEKKSENNDRMETFKRLFSGLGQKSPQT